jgi:uncharacterized membrane protein
MNAGMSTRLHLGVFILAMVAGFTFAAFSTYDFAQHLDRQVHDLHCSFVPGLTDTAKASESDCQVTMMSPYSSVMRGSLWGGIPISLAGMGLFAFLAYRGVVTTTRPVAARRGAAGLLLALSALPLITSVVMGTIALTELDAACKLCIGIYGSSLVGFLAAGLAYAAARKDAAAEGDTDTGPSGGTDFFVALLEMGACVLIPIAAYAAVMPDHARFIGSCGKLEQPKDQYGVLVPLGGGGGGAQVIEVLDPLCPTCRAFEERLRASGLDAKIDRKVLLFPLDSECNWNVTASLHPGACAVSEAVLCADGSAETNPRQVVDWAFEHQPDLLAAGKKDRASLEQAITTRFPSLTDCIGSPAVQSKLNKSLRWAVGNSLPVLTPQVYVNGVQLCGEDSDLGLEFTLQRMIGGGS